MKRSFKSVSLGFLSVLIGLLVLIQFVPYGRNHTNPAVVQEPSWDSPETRQLVKQTCFDCHSNETVWPWYSHIAPVSWLVYRDVAKGRDELNFSEWGSHPKHEESEEIVEQIRKGNMPLPVYLLAHPEARLSDAQKERLIRGLSASTRGGASSPREAGEHD